MYALSGEEQVPEEDIKVGTSPVHKSEEESYQQVPEVNTIVCEDDDKQVPDTDTTGSLVATFGDRVSIMKRKDTLAQGTIITPLTTTWKILFLSLQICLFLQL